MSKIQLQHLTFNNMFSYGEDNNLSLITELRESTILKEFHFTPHIVTERFIDYLFGDKFFTNETIFQNFSPLPLNLSGN